MLSSSSQGLEFMRLPNLVHQLANVPGNVVQRRVQPTLSVILRRGLVAADESLAGKKWAGLLD